MMAELSKVRKTVKKYYYFNQVTWYLIKCKILKDGIIRKGLG